MRQIFGFIMMLISFSVYSEAFLNSHTAVIQKTDLESHTIDLNGRSMTLSPKVRVLDKNNRYVGLRGLKQGSKIEYQMISEKPINNLQGNRNISKISDIRILTNETKRDTLK